jgi:hypothetical protein
MLNTNYMSGLQIGCMENAGSLRLMVFDFEYELAKPVLWTGTAWVPIGPIYHFDCELELAFIMHMQVWGA